MNNDKENASTIILESKYLISSQKNEEQKFSYHHIHNLMFREYFPKQQIAPSHLLGHGRRLQEAASLRVPHHSVFAALRLQSPLTFLKKRQNFNLGNMLLLQLTILKCFKSVNWISLVAIFDEQ